VADVHDRRSCPVIFRVPLPADVYRLAQESEHRKMKMCAEVGKLWAGR